MDKKEKRACIIRWIVSVCLIVISVLMFVYISKSYARNVLFQKSHSFVWVSILLFLPFVLMHCRNSLKVKDIKWIVFPWHSGCCIVNRGDNLE